MRDAEIESFLAQTNWAGATRTALPFDASLRRYHRLTLNGDSAILMDAPPASGEDLPAFLHFASHLSACGLSAPECYASDISSGFLILEDFGSADFAAHLKTTPADEPKLYASAAQALAQLHRHPAAAAPNYKTEEMCKAAQLAPVWYGNGDADPTLNTIFEDLLGPLEPEMNVLALRDYHAQNLMWLPEREGVKCVGQLDFQSAGIGHFCYDLCSLIYDARRDVSEGGRSYAIQAFAEASGQSVTQLSRPIAILTLQRNVRILGIFGRLASSYGRPSYLEFLPRVWSFVLTALEQIGQANVRKHILATLPPPEKARRLIEARRSK